MLRCETVPDTDYSETSEFDHGEAELVIRFDGAGYVAATVDKKHHRQQCFAGVDGPVNADFDAWQHLVVSNAVGSRRGRVYFGVGGKRSKRSCDIGAGASASRQHGLPEGVAPRALAPAKVPGKAQVLQQRLEARFDNARYRCKVALTHSAQPRNVADDGDAVVVKGPSAGEMKPLAAGASDRQLGHVYHALAPQQRDEDCGLRVKFHVASLT
ncbi:unannotated protein [freshwater metagenome]|uniref:Unannotated protein n=1 Tax=freshwater metagenome TaxID=449393 RepID=A0A6J6Q9K8_9ZZZZ